VEDGGAPVRHALAAQDVALRGRAGEEHVALGAGPLDAREAEDGDA
jgi:hypothetical protein